MSRQQLDILRSQDAVLAILENFSGKEMPSRQKEIQDTVQKILAIVAHQPTGS
jgi:hypothetical protein